MRGVAALMIASVMFSAACTPGSRESSSTASSQTCGYLYEWVTRWRFPLQPDPHAAYSYVVPKITDEPIGFEIRGAFPYAAWTSWMVYTDAAQPFSLVQDAAITPEDGSQNPFVAGTKVLASDRSFRLLVVPKGIDRSSLAASLRDVPMTNVLERPKRGEFFIVANRVYNAFPGYNQGGAGGPTDTPFPAVRAVNLQTGEGVACAKFDELPDGRSPEDMPSGTTGAASTGSVMLRGGRSASVGVQARTDSGSEGAEFAPTLDPALIEFTRPPLLPGADISSIPPPDSCAGYLGAATSTTEIGLIRMPHVARWFDTTDLTPDSAFRQEETAYISFTQYGSKVGSYDPGSTESDSLGNEELLVDGSGGSTIVVWPRGLSAADQQLVFDHARGRGWALLRGGAEGAVTTPNLFVRLKGASPGYQGGYTPTADRQGVPCYFDDHPDAEHWSDVAGDEYVASARNVGAGAPQGVNCTLEAYIDGSCLDRLEAHIAQGGGRYSA